MKNILYICPSTGVGGAETFLKQTWQHRNPNKVNNYYLLFSRGPLYEDLKQMGAPVLLLEKRPRLSRRSGHKLVADKVSQIIEKYDIHLIHSTMAYSALFIAIPARRAQIPHVWFQHGPVSGWMDRLAGILPHKAVITNSQFTSNRQKTIEKPLSLFVPKMRIMKKLTLGTNLVPPSPEQIGKFRTELLQSHGLPANTFIISMLCRIQPLKGVHLLQEALDGLRKYDFNIPVHAFVWGETLRSDAYFEKIKQAVKEQDTPLSFPGTTRQPELVLAASDALINASVKPEAFGLTLIEAMSVGTSVIGPNFGGPKEIIRDESNGLLFESGKSYDLTDKIIRISKDLSLRKELAHQARADVEANYLAKNTIQSLEDFYFDSLLE